MNVALSRPGRPRVKSSRNLIIVEADRVDLENLSAGDIGAAGRSTVIRDLKIERLGTATAVTLVGIGRLNPVSIRELTEGRRRVVLEFANVSSAVPRATTARAGPGLAGADRPEPAVAARHRGRDGAGAALGAPDRDLRRRPTSDGALRRAGRRRAAAAAARPWSRRAAGRARGRPPGSPAGARRRSGARRPAERRAERGRPPQARFTGHPVSLDFQGADLRSVLRTFSEISGLNLVIDPSIQGSVDVSLRDVPWDQALDIILKANRLGYVVDGTIVRVAPLTVLADEEVQRRKLQDEQALAGELRVMTRSLSYARAEDLKALLTATALSQRGTIQTDARTNTIIINDLADRLERAGSLITALDVPQPQVEIEARIVQTSRSFAVEPRRQVGHRRARYAGARQHACRWRSRTQWRAPAAWGSTLRPRPA